MAPALVHVAYQVELIFIYVLVFLQIANLVVNQLQVVLTVGIRQICVEVWRFLCGCYSTLMNRHAGPLGKAMQEQLDDFRIEQCRKCVKIFANVAALAAMPATLYGQTNVYEPSVSTMVNAGLWVVVLLCLLLVSLDYLQLTKMRLDIFYAIIHVTAYIYYARLTDDPRFFVNAASRAVARMALGILYLDYGKTLLWNLMASIIICWRYPYNSSILLVADAAQEFMMTEALVCVGVSWVAFVVQRWLEGRFRLQLGAQNQKRATVKLAAYRCDAVVWLTPSLHLCGPAKQFADMLFMSDAPKHLDGKFFQNYIATEADRNRFHDFLVQSMASLQPHGLPAPCFLQLRDSASRVFLVEVLHSCFVNSDDQIGHLIGISEAGANAEVPEARTDEENERPVLPQALTTEPEIIGRQVDEVDSVAIAPDAGRQIDEVGFVAIELEAGRQSDEVDSVAIAPGAGRQSDGVDRVAVAPGAGRQSDGVDSAAIAPDVGSQSDEVDRVASAAVAVRQMDEVESVASAPSATGRNIRDATYNTMPSMMPLIPEHEALAPLSIVLDAHTLKILGCTSGFATLVGPLVAATHIRKVMANFQQFAGWMQDWANSFDQRQQESEPLSVKLARYPRRAGRTIRYRAEAVNLTLRTNVRGAEMGVPLGQDRSDEEHDILCVVEFRHVEVDVPDQTKSDKATAVGGTSSPASSSGHWVQSL